MKFKILKENLENGLNIVGRIVGKNLTLPILNNVFISTEKNFLNLTTTDLEIALKYWCLSKNEKEGSITVPLKVLSNYINLLTEDVLQIEVKNQIFYVIGSSFKTQFKTQPSEDFPIIPKIDTSNFVEVNSIVFCEGLDQVVDFVAINQSRPEISGVFLNFQKDVLKITATDSFRLAEKTLYFKEKQDKIFSFILPQKTTKEIINIFGDKKDKIKIYFTPNQIMVESLMKEVKHPQIQLISRLIEGEYPNYEEVIPKTYQIQTILPKSEFLNQIKTASVFSGKGKEVKIKVNVKKQEIEIFSQNPDIGENKSTIKGEVKCNSSTTKEMEVVFNYKFLIDGILKIQTPRIIFELNGEEGPAVLKPEKEEDFIYIVMPIKST